MSGYWWAPDDLQAPESAGLGAAHSVSDEKPPKDPARAVREVAEEVTRKSFTPPKRPIGFYA